ncbi:MAG: aldehyde ferredoxin oxidoreductase N-terminal domain-containing protein [Eggerthellaceae bacterium]
MALTASGASAGRTTLAHLSTFTKDHLVVDSHMGGMFGAKLKLAGWDALIIEGQSDKPVFVKIIDGDITIESADGVWGLAPRCNRGTEHPGFNRACVATIGPAGETSSRTPTSSTPATTRRCRRGRHSRLQEVQGRRCRGQRFRQRPEAIAELSDYVSTSSAPTTTTSRLYPAGMGGILRRRILLDRATADLGSPKAADQHRRAWGELNTVGYRRMKSTKDPALPPKNIP